MYKKNHGSVHFDNLISNKTKMKLKLTRFAGLILGLFIISGNIEITDGLVAETAIIAEATEIIGVVRIGVSLVDYIYKGRINFLVHQHLISCLNFSANNSLLFQYFQISFVILELLTKSWMCQRIKRLKKGYLLSIEWSVQLWIDWKMVMKLLKALLNKCMKNFQIF